LPLEPHTNSSGKAKGEIRQKKKGSMNEKQGPNLKQIANLIALRQRVANTHDGVVILDASHQDFPNLTDTLQQAILNGGRVLIGLNGNSTVIEKLKWIDHNA
jgi:hypothetical protein